MDNETLQDKPSTLLVNGCTDYSFREKIAALDPDAYASLRRGLTATQSEMKLPAEQWVKPAEGEPWASDTPWHHEALMDTAELQVWTDAGIQITIRKVRGLVYLQPEPASPFPTQAKDLLSGPTIVNVSVPGGFGLWQVQSVSILEDACTDALQDTLDNGWRILAVCPPNDRRRPTYIMGHHDKGMSL